MLSFDRQVSEIVHSCYFHILAHKHIRAYLSLDTAISVCVCIVAARLDYCNSLLYSTSNRNLDKLQHIQNLLARTVTNASWSDKATDITRSLHCMAAHQTENPVQGWATCLQNSTLIVPSISSGHILSSHHPTRQLRSSSVHQFFEPSVNSNFASRAFSISIPSVCSNLTSALLTLLHLSNPS